MMAVSDFDDLLQIALDEKIDVAIIGAGLFLKNPEDLGSTHTKFVPKVSSARAAKLIFQYWSDKFNKVPDAIVTEGPLCGGHIGFSRKEIQNPANTLLSIVQATAEVIKPFEQKYGREIPVISGGGVYTGAQMYDIIQGGAKAVKMGTRFVTTHECDVSDAFKQNYLNCTKDDITIVDSPVGLPGRVITNDFVKDIQAGKQKPVNCPWKCLRTCDYKKVAFCIAEALFSAASGDFDNGFSFAGSNAYLATEIISVKETIERIKQEYAQRAMEFAV